MRVNDLKICYYLDYIYYNLVKEASAKISDVSLVAPLQSMKTRKTLKHHLKVIAFDWSPDQRHIYSGGEVSQLFQTF